MRQLFRRRNSDSKKCTKFLLADWGMVADKGLAE